MKLLDSALSRPFDDTDHEALYQMLGNLGRFTGITMVNFCKQLC